MNEENTKTVSIHKIAKQFEKIYNGLNQEQLEQMDEELLKIHPSEESDVFMSADYDEDENSIGISIFISNPLPQENLQKLSFDKLMFEYLIRADIKKLPTVLECLELMERKGSEQYEIHYMPVFYTEQLGDYDIHFRITKL